ncbi:MAG: NAD-dependent epimerase/dehydratase family protein [Thermoproteota archaeon]
MPDWKGRSVLITGGAGFLGSHLADMLLNKGASISILDNFAIGSKRNLENSLEKMGLIDHDLSKGNLPLKKDFDCIFHLAAIASPHQCEKFPSDAFKVNVQGTFEILKFALKSSARKVIFTSSAFLYGNNPRYLPLDEKHPLDTTESVYSITKKLGEDLCRTFKNEHSLPITILRLFNTFGPRQTSDYLIPTIIEQAANKGKVQLWSDKPVRDFNFVSNTVDALIAVAESDDMGNNVYNVGSGEEISIKDISTVIASEFNAEVEFLDKPVVGPLRLRCDNSLMKEIFNWTPKVKFMDGLKQTINWYKSHQKLPSIK